MRAMDHHGTLVMLCQPARNAISVWLIDVDDVIVVPGEVSLRGMLIGAGKLQQVMQVAVSDAASEIGSPHLVDVVSEAAQCLDCTNLCSRGAGREITRHIGHEKDPHQ